MIRASLLAAIAVPGVATPAELPSVDTPLKTGLKALSDEAVVIGIENYTYLPTTPYALRDAQAVYDFLLYTRGVPADRIVLMKGANSRKKVLDAVAAAGKNVGKGGTVWVYFAGHGTASPTTKERLVLLENTPASEEGYDEMGIEVAELQQLAGSGGGDVMMITDACFTGVGRDGAAMKVGGRSFVPGAAKAIGKAAQWDAAQPNQVAGPLNVVEHGAFTYFAIGAMRGWADGQISGKPDGTVTSDEAQAYVDVALRSVGIRDQEPSLVGENAFARTLSTGAKDKPPVLSALAVVEPERAAVPVEPEGGGTTFGGGKGTGVSSKVAAQRCDDAARLVADENHAAALAGAVKKVQSAATTRWRELEPEATACLELRASSDREACAREVDAFVAAGRAAKATLSAHTEVVSTDCGARERSYDPESASVTVAEVAKAEALAARLREAPKQEAPKQVAAAAVSGVSPSGSAVGGDLVDTGIPGLGDEGMTLPGGSFTMGSASGTGDADEQPARKVTISAFVMGRTEVSQKLWTSVMASNPSEMDYKSVSLLGGTLPVQNVSWCDSVAFANKLSAKQGLAAAYRGVESCVETKSTSVAVVSGANGWRLPTEAEWEYAAKAGTEQTWSGTSETSGICGVGNVGDAAAKSKGTNYGDVALCNDNFAVASPAGTFKPNAWGLYDTTGNVWEWTGDWKGDSYSGLGTSDPTVASAGSLRVFRGGSWFVTPAYARVALRDWNTPDVRRFHLGLRLARAGS